MTHFVYELTPVRIARRPPKVPPCPNKMWLKHASNRVYLRWLYARASRLTRMQIDAELEVCERKLAYWQRQPDWDQSLAGQALAAMREQRHELPEGWRG